MQNYVFDFEWGASKYANDNGMPIDDQRIFVTRDPDSAGHQAASKKGTWSTKIDLYVSDDLFRTSTMVIEGGNTIVKTSQWMYIACSHTDE